MGENSHSGREWRTYPIDKSRSGDGNRRHAIDVIADASSLPPTPTLPFWFSSLHNRRGGAFVSSTIHLPFGGMSTHKYPRFSFLAPGSRKQSLENTVGACQSSWKHCLAQASVWHSLCHRLLFCDFPSATCRLIISRRRLRGFLFSSSPFRILAPSFRTNRVVRLFVYVCQEWKESFSLHRRSLDSDGSWSNCRSCLPSFGADRYRLLLF